jgi:hypothetical protein
MRWPWQRERTQPGAEEIHSGRAEQPAVMSQVPPKGWAFLPPLQRTIGNIQLTADPEHFTGALAAWCDPSFTGPMAHLVSADAPPGVIDVDGGGPVPGNEGYSPSSIEMTLLPPPAPRIRTKPGGQGIASSLQRTAPDGGIPARASLLAAESEAFPTLQVDTIPLHEPELLPEPEISVSPESVPKSATSVVAPAETVSEVSQSRMPSQAGALGRTDGSTSDGFATYVPLPSAPAVQRTSSGTSGTSPLSPPAPHPSKLGLGMPLSFSESDKLAGPGAAASDGLSGLPVQRSTTDLLGYSEPSVHASIQGPNLGANATVDETAPLQEEPKPSVPPDGTAAILLSTAVPHESAAKEDIEARPEARLTDASAASPPQMPVASRLALAGSGAATGKATDGMDVDDARTGDVISAVSSAELAGTGLAAARNGVAAIQAESVYPAAESDPGPPLVDFRRGLAVAGDRFAQRDVDSASTYVQREAEPRQNGQRNSRQSDGPSVGSISSSNQPRFQVQRASQSEQSTQPTQPSGEPQARMIPTAATPVVLRVVRTTSPGTTPETWQRPTGMSATVQKESGKLVPGLAPTPSQGGRPSEITPNGRPSGQTVPISSDAAESAKTPLGVPWDSEFVADIGSDRAPGSGFDIASVSASEADPAADIWPGAPPEPDAAVGRSIQRTLAKEREEIAGQGQRLPFGSGRLAKSHPDMNGTGTQPGGRGPDTLERSAVSSATFLLPPEAHAKGAPVRAGGLANTTAAELSAYTPTYKSWSPPRTLGLAVQPTPRAAASDGLQRDAAISAFEARGDVPTASLEAPADSATATLVTSSTAANVQTDAETAPAGTAQQVPTTRGNGTAQTADAAAPSTTPEQLEALAKQLTGPLIRRIKAEMLLDRERRGLRTDMN